MGKTKMEGILALMIPILALIIPIIAIWTTHQRKIEEIRAKALSDNAAHTAARSQVLEERVRILEAIVTDKGYDVAAQIEALRTPPAIEPARRKQ
jgi:mannitol-1-phosphate/altronate dehydrogenase